jgi:serine protease
MADPGFRFNGTAASPVPAASGKVGDSIDALGIPARTGSSLSQRFFKEVVLRCSSHGSEIVRRPQVLAVFIVLIVLTIGGCGGGSGDGGAEPVSFTVSGEVRPEALNRADSDTDDPESPTIRNDRPDQAQTVIAPALIGGFVAAPGTTSRFGPAADELDTFNVELRAGQEIVLEFPDALAADLDLYLANEQAVIIDGSIGTGTTESLSAPADGRYFVVVQAFSGRSNYWLRLEAADAVAPVSRHGPRLSDDFVPGEMIVRTDHRAGKSAPDAVFQAQTVGMISAAGAPDREQLWRIPEGQEGLVLQSLGVAPGAFMAMRWASPDLHARHRTLVAIKGLQRRAEVTAASPNFRLQPQLLPNDPLQGFQWHQPNVELPAAWDISTGRSPDAEVIVAVIDTGVFLNHADLRTKLVPGYDFIRDPTSARDGDGIDPDPDDPGDSPLPGQSSWHGSHVAGIAAAATNNATGVAGVSWGARIMPVRTLGAGGGVLYDTLQGIRFAAGLPNDSGTVPARPADVINLSLGGGVFSSLEANLYQEIRNRGIFVIAAAGNDAGPVSFPAAYDSVFAVGATDAINQRAYYSSYGDRLDLVAPGGDMRVDRTGDGYPDGILSTVADDTSGTRLSAYGFKQGTSMATPVVSGVVALARSRQPSLTPNALAFLLQSGSLTDDLGPAGWDPQTGWGQISALKTLVAVADLGDPVELPPLLSAAPSQLEFGFTGSEADLLLRNSGGGTLEVTEVRADASWLSVTPSSIDDSGLGVYRVVAERDGLPPNDYSGSIEVRAEGLPDLLVPVSLRVAARELSLDSTGRIYVLLMDEEGRTVAERGVNPADGSYLFRFEDVPQGTYRIAAGTDMNNDGLICDPGEACGAFPTLSLFEQIEVDRSLTGLDFSVGFRDSPRTTAFSREGPAGGEIPGFSRLPD